jgi:hypothetical protein
VSIGDGGEIGRREDEESARPPVSKSTSGVGKDAQYVGLALDIVESACPCRVCVVRAINGSRVLPMVWYWHVAYRLYLQSVSLDPTNGSIDPKGNTPQMLLPALSWKGSQPTNNHLHNIQYVPLVTCVAILYRALVPASPFFVIIPYHQISTCLWFG